MEATEERSSTCQCGVGGGGRGHTLPQKEEVLVLSPPTPHICPERVLLLLSTEKVCKTKAKTQILGGGGLRCRGIPQSPSEAGEGQAMGGRVGRVGGRRVHPSSPQTRQGSRLSVERAMAPPPADARILPSAAQGQPGEGPSLSCASSDSPNLIKGDTPFTQAN